MALSVEQRYALDPLSKALLDKERERERERELEATGRTSLCHIRTSVGGYAGVVTSTCTMIFWIETKESFVCFTAWKTNATFKKCIEILNQG